MAGKRPTNQSLLLEFERPQPAIPAQPPSKAELALDMFFVQQLERLGHLDFKPENRAEIEEFKKVFREFRSRDSLENCVTKFIRDPKRSKFPKVGEFVQELQDILRLPEHVPLERPEPICKVCADFGYLKKEGTVERCTCANGISLPAQILSMLRQPAPSTGGKRDRSGELLRHMLGVKPKRPPKKGGGSK